VPVSLFRFKDGHSVFRVGNTIYSFDADGNYDGPEARFAEGVMTSPRSPEFARFTEALEQGATNRDRAPDGAYFDEGSSGHDAERAIWPKGNGKAK